MQEAAGQAMLSVGQIHTPGTFLGFFLSEAAGVLISIVMLVNHREYRHQVCQPSWMVLGGLTNGSIHAIIHLVSNGKLN